MKRLFTEEEVREIIGEIEDVETIPFEMILRKGEPDPKQVFRNQLRQEQLAILEKMRGEGKV